MYRSTDRGDNWTGVLALDLPTSPSFQVPIWARITFHPTDPNTIYIPSSHGLYVTYDNAVTWYELGVNPIRKTADNGTTWQNCGDTGVTCESFMANPPCTSGTTCLPIQTDLVTHPHMMDLEVHTSTGGGTIMTAVLETPEHAQGTCTGTLSYLWDADLQYLKSGPYRSTDGGLTWTPMFVDADELDGNQYSRAVACSSSAIGGWNDTTWSQIHANPDDPDHFFLESQYIFGGIIERRNGKWKHLSRHGTGEICADYACFEGNRSQGLWGNQQGPLPFDSTVPDWTATNPPFYIASRGVLRADYSEAEGRYRFEHLDSDPVNNDSNRWAGKGLDDFCPTAMVAFDDNETLFVSGADVGVVTSSDYGVSWSRSDADAGNDDESLAIIYDEPAGRVYASRYITSQNTHSLTTTTDLGQTWQVLGGYCAGTCTLTSNQGLEPDNDIYSLAIDFATTSTDRAVWLGTEQGLWRYDPTAADGSRFAAISGTGCPPAPRLVEEVLTFSDRPGIALFTVKDDVTSNFIRHGRDPGPNTGIYLADTTGSSPVCTNLVGGTEARAPTRVAVATNPDSTLSLVAGGRTDFYPVIYRTQFDFANPTSIDWSITASHDLLKTTTTNFLDSTNFHLRNFADLVVAPNKPQVVLAPLKANPYFDGYQPRHVYVSYDGGQTFRVAAELQSLPERNLAGFHFDSTGANLYVLGLCGQHYRMGSPYATGCDPGKVCNTGLCVDP